MCTLLLPGGLKSLTTPNTVSYNNLYDTCIDATQVGYVKFTLVNWLFVQYVWSLSQVQWVHSRNTT